jgi:hypothetical protein
LDTPENAPGKGVPKNKKEQEDIKLKAPKVDPKPKVAEIMDFVPPELAGAM